ncbi:MAG: lysylphosphatidylglycerol synthase transmembrane domain-containing protein [Acidiferrobacterales bacterium]
MNNNAETRPQNSHSLGKHAIRIIVSVGLFVLIFRAVDFREVLGVFKSSNPWLLVPALGLQILSALIAAIRWHMIMRELSFGKDLPFYIRCYFKGTFFNQALPTSIGGDALRVIETAKVGGGKREAFYGVFIDRIVGLLGLLLINLAAIFANPIFLEKNAAVHYAIVGMAVFGFAGVLTLAWIGNLEWLARNKITKLIHDLSHRLRRVYRSGRTIATQSVLSIVIHLLSMMTVYFIGLSVGLDYGLLVYIVVVPPVILLTIIPISLAGWGVRETGMIGLFLLIGAQKAPILSVSLIYGLILVAASTPGMYFFLLGKRHKRAIK